MEAHDALDALIGQTIDDRYVVKRFLGKGGMGAVYEADHIGLGKRVAIKFLPEGSDSDAKRRFHREARAASAISHEHVVHVFDVGAANGREYFAMELVEGKELQKLIDYEGALDPARAVAIGKQILAGLGAIHAAGLVHRDIKPSNILLVSRDGGELAKIMDFGVSKTVAVGDDTITSLGRVVGTPQYMAPEQIAGDTVDHRADLYATGIALYAMLCGKVPFGGTKVTKIAQQHLVERPASLATLRPGLPAPVIAAVARALEKDPDDRFQSAKDFADALDGKDIAPMPRIGAVTKKDRPSKRATSSAAPTVETRPRGTRLLLVLALLGAAALVATAAYWLRHDSDPASSSRLPASGSNPSPSPPPPPSPSQSPSPSPSPPPPRPPPQVAAPKPAKSCLCVPTDRVSGTSSLCKRLDPHCRCERHDGITLCPKWIDPDHCVDPQYVDHAKPGTPDAPCSGMATANDPEEVGHLDCMLCVKEADFHYQGHDDDACAGFSQSTRKHVPGVMTDCR